MKQITTSAIALCCLALTPSAQALNFNFITTGLSAQATTALNLAGSSWSSQLLDPVTINIEVNLTNLNDANVIGNANSTFLQSGYTGIRNSMVTDAANEADDGIVGYLPTAGQFSTFVPAGGFTLSGNLKGTKANFKALGYSGLDASIRYQRWRHQF